MKRVLERELTSYNANVLCDATQLMMNDKAEP